MNSPLKMSFLSIINTYPIPAINIKNICLLNFCGKLEPHHLYYFINSFHMPQPIMNEVLDIKGFKDTRKDKNLSKYLQQEN